LLRAQRIRELATGRRLIEQFRHREPGGTVLRFLRRLALKGAKEQKAHQREEYDRAEPQPQREGMQEFADAEHGRSVLQAIFPAGQQPPDVALVPGKYQHHGQDAEQ